MTVRTPSDLPPASISLSAYAQQEAERVMLVARSLSFCAVLILTAIAVKSWLSNHEQHGLVLALFSGLILANSLLYSHLKQDDVFKNLFLVLIIALMVYLTASGGENNTGILWFYVFPPFIFYLTEQRVGIIATLLVILCALIIFRFPELPFVATVYSSDFQLRFLASISFVSVFCFVMDYARRSAKRELIRMAKLYEKASRTDELTQLPNRRDMWQQLEQEYFRFERSGNPFSVILFDIDHFKMVNDTYGHDAGDFVLVRFAELLKETCRKMDIASRWGGEEFLVLLPETGLDQALALAERLRKHIEQAVVNYKQQDIRITASGGVCAINLAQGLNGLLKQADINLYQAKVLGRNRITPEIPTHLAKQ